jgi:uncharacterized protein (TIGR02271 family)
METRGIAEGMAVRDAEGRNLGSVIECRADRFLVEKGLFFPKDFELSYDRVESVAGGEVRIRLEAGERDEEREEVRVPLASEELEAGKRERKAGEVRISVPVEEDVEVRKRPVVREEVRVSKVRQEGEQRAGAEVRHEQARIEREGDTSGSPVPRDEPEEP